MCIKNWAAQNNIKKITTQNFIPYNTFKTWYTFPLLYLTLVHILLVHIEVTAQK